MSTDCMVTGCLTWVQWQKTSRPLACWPSAHCTAMSICNGRSKEVREEEVVRVCNPAAAAPPYPSAVGESSS